MYTCYRQPSLPRRLYHHRHYLQHLLYLAFGLLGAFRNELTDRYQQLGFMER
jgi:hypothetical protein